MSTRRVGISAFGLVVAGGVPAGPPEADATSFAHSLQQLLATVASGEATVFSDQERRLLARVKTALSAFEVGWRVSGR